MKYFPRLILITIASAIFIIVAVLKFHSNIATKSEINETLLIQTYEAIEVSTDLLQKTLQTESVLNDFVITKDTDLLESLKNNSALSKAHLVKLNKLMTGNPAQHARLDTLNALHDKFSVHTTQHLLTITKNGASKEVQIAELENNKQIANQIVNVLSRFIDTEQALAINYGRDAVKLNHNTFLMLFIGMGAGFIMLGFLLVLLYRENQARKIDTRELFLKNQWFDKIMISLGDGLIAIDAHGIINMINPSAAIITGWKEQLALGSHIDKIFEITDEVTGLTVINPAIQAIQENKMVPLANHTFLEQKNGNKIYIDDSGAPMHNENGEVIGAVLIFRDVSEKKKGEDALRDLNLSLEKKVEERTLEVVKSEKRLKEAQKISHTGNWEIDLITAENNWSDEFYNILDLETGVIQPSTKAFLNLIFPADRAMAQNKLQQGFDSLTESNFNFRFTGKEGTLKHGYINWQFENDRNNRPLRLYGILQDITERKSAEEKLERRNLELKKINAELDRFVYSSSHDLRAPLTSVMGLINIIDDNLGTKEIEQRERVEMMKQSITKLDDFIEDIINYSRNSRTEIKKDEINFEALITESKQSMKYLKGNSELKINVEVVQIGKFISDESRILVSINNLISNTIKYRDKNKPNSHVKITVQSDESKAILTVEDNGIGIGGSKKDKIFDMFYRGTKLSDGSGLGMYITKEMLTKLDGSIVFESKLKFGTTFTVMIPNLIEINKNL